MGNTQSWGVLARSRPRATGLVASTLLLGIGFALAAPGNLDPSFNGSGLLSLRVGDYEGSATAVVQQTDGKLVLAGWGRLNGSDNEDFIVMRVAEDGTRDSTFGTNGVASADFTGLWDSANAVIQQSDGKLVLAGEAGGGIGPGKIALARFNADGTLDSTFGSNGRTLVDFGSGTGSRAEDLAQQPDGKLVVAGTTYSGGSSRLVFARFDADGSLDTTFGTGGTTLVDFGSGTSSSAEDLAQQPDGKLVAVGTVVGPGGSNFGVARVSANGALDLSFDGDGLLAVEIVGTAMTVAIQPDDKIVVAGSAYPGGTYHSAALLRVNSDGSLDNHFGTSGKTIVDLGNHSDLNSIVVQADGKLVATGTRYVEGYNMILTRFESDGALDMSFGFDGVSTVDFGTGSQAPEAYGVALVQQADGKTVAVGPIEFQPFGAFGAARFDDGAAFAGRIGLTRTVNFVSETTPTVTYTVRRTGGRTGTVSVDFATAAGQAQPGSDFVGASGTLTWNDGDSSDKTLTIDIIDDAVAEKIREDFSLTLSGPTGGAQLAASEGSTTITDADGPGELVFLNQYAWSSHMSATEEDVVIQVPVARLHGSQGAVSVGYQVPNQFSSSTATPGIDFACASGTLSWNDGEADTKYVAVQIIDDTAQETAEFFEIRLVVPGTARTYAGPASRQSIQIIDDGDSGGGGGGDCESGGGGIGFVNNSLSVQESGRSALLPVFRRGNSSSAASVKYATSSGSATAGSDFTTASGTLDWAAGDSANKTMSVSIPNDSADESDETFTVTLSNPTGGGVLGSNSAATVTIVDDDTSGGDGGSGGGTGGSGGGSGGGDGGSGGSGGGGGGTLDWLVGLFLTCFSLRSRGSTKRPARNG